MQFQCLCSCDCHILQAHFGHFHISCHQHSTWAALRVTSSGHHCGAQVRACSRQLFGSVDKERRAGGEGGTLLRGNPLCWLSTGGAGQGGVAGAGGASSGGPSKLRAWASSAPCRWLGRQWQRGSGRSPQQQGELTGVRLDGELKLCARAS